MMREEPHVEERGERWKRRSGGEEAGLRRNMSGSGETQKGVLGAGQLSWEQTGDLTLNDAGREWRLTWRNVRIPEWKG